MKIKAKIDRMVNAGSIKAIASVSLDSQFVVKNLRVVDGKKGLFVAFPQESYAGRDGAKQYANIFYPISNAGKTDLEQAVLDAYSRQLTQCQTRNAEQDFLPLEEDGGMLPFSM